jgi:hypothetical protein
MPKLSPQTAVYIHGIDNKPPREVLKCQWDLALFGVPHHDRSRLAFWVNRDRYPAPYPGSCDEEDSLRPESLLYSAEIDDQPDPLASTIEALAEGNATKRAALRRIAREVSGLPLDSPAPAFAEPVRHFLTEQITLRFIRDAHDFFYVSERRQEMENSLRLCLEETPGPHIVIAHSLGSVIAYNFLRHSGASCDIALFVTLGSPLGLSSMRAQFRRPEFHGAGGPLPVPACIRAWINVSARFDLVCRVKRLASLFTPRSIEDHVIHNPATWRDAHSATGYLRSVPVQKAIRSHAIPLFNDLGPETRAG